MATTFVGALMLVPYNFAPTGYALCQGQLLPISQNTALFSLLGTYYGGDGKSTFALPNLSGSVAVGQGQGPGLTLREIGETGGEPTVTLITAEVPPHSHQLLAAKVAADVNTPGGNALATNTGTQFYSDQTSNLAGMSQSSLTPSGGGQPHNNMMPFQALNWIIALQGVFPPRS